MLRLANPVAALVFVLLTQCGSERASAPPPAPSEWVDAESGARFRLPGDGWRRVARGTDADAPVLSVERGPCAGQAWVHEGPNDYLTAKARADALVAHEVAAGHTVVQDRKLLFHSVTGHRVETQWKTGEKTQAQRVSWWPVGDQLFELRATAVMTVSREARRCLDTLTTAFDVTAPRRK